MSQRRPYPIVDPLMSAANTSSYTPVGRGSNSHVQTNEMLESQNDQMVQQMADKVKQLRSVSIDIGEEMKRHNSMLGGMGEDMDNTGGLLGSSMTRLKGLTNAGHNRWMCYLILFILAVFFLCYFIIKWRT